MMEWFEKLEDMKGLVIKYLKEHPHTRESDVELFFMILKEYYRAMPSNKKQSLYEEQFLSDLYVLLKLAPDKSSISRLRRRVQNDDGMYESTKITQQMRRTLERHFAEWAVR